MDKALIEVLLVSSVTIPGEIVAVGLGVLLLLTFLLLSGVGSYLKRLISPSEVLLSAEQARRMGLPRRERLGFFSHLFAAIYLAAVFGIGYVGRTIWLNSVALQQQPPMLAQAPQPERIKELLAGNPTLDSNGLITISPSDLNAILQNHLRLEPRTQSGPFDSLALVRTGLMAFHQEDCLVLSEMVTFLNFPMRIEYLIPLGQQEENGLKIRANGVPVIGYIASYLWEHLAGQLGSAYRALPIAPRYKFLGVGTKGLSFQYFPPTLHGAQGNN